MFHRKRPLILPAEGERTDEIVWRAWRKRNRLEEHDRQLARVTAVKALFVAVLLLTIVFWSSAADYASAIRLALTVAATFAAMQAFKLRSYALAMIFGAMAVIYNPVFPVFLLTGSTAFAIVAMTAVAVGASMMYSSIRAANVDV
jgi:hypothetical protein